MDFLRSRGDCTGDLLFFSVTTFFMGPGEDLDATDGFFGFFGEFESFFGESLLTCLEDLFATGEEVGVGLSFSSAITVLFMDVDDASATTASSSENSSWESLCCCDCDCDWRLFSAMDFCRFRRRRSSLLLLLLLVVFPFDDCI